MLAGLGRAYLGTRDADVIERLLRTGRHDKAAERLTARLARRPSARDRDWLAAMPTG